MKLRIAAIAAVLLIGGAAWSLTETALHLPESRRVTSTPSPGYTQIEIRASDGIPLRADFRPGSNGHALVLLHGLGDTRRGMRGFAAYYHEQGFSVLLPDSRAHGTSGGNTITYGVLEAGDLRRWLHWLASTQHARSTAAIGMSMGASVALLALDDPLLRAVIAECPYSSFRAIAYDRAPALFNLPPAAGLALAPLIEPAFLYARLRHGIWLPAADPASTLARARQPVLLIHGLADDRTPPHHSRALYTARPTNTQLWLVPNARHVRASVVQPDEYRHRTLNFLHTFKSSNW